MTGGTLYAGKIGEKHRGNKCPGRTLPNLSNVAAIESLAKECFISKEDTDAFIAGKRKFLLKVLLTRQSGSVTEKLTEEMLLLQDSGYAIRLARIFRPC